MGRELAPYSTLVALCLVVANRNQLSSPSGGCTRVGVHLSKVVVDRKPLTDEAYSPPPILAAAEEGLAQWRVSAPRTFECL